MEPTSFWSNDEVGALVQLVVEGNTYPEISQLLERSPEACRSKARQLKLRHPKSNRPWGSDEARTAASLDWMEFSRLYPTATPAEYQTSRELYRERVDVPDFEVQDYSKLIQVVEGNVAVACCVHCPETDESMWAKLLAIGERDKLPGLIIAGDLVVADMFSNWPQDGVGQSWGHDIELESIRRHMKTALEVFEWIYILPGNHVGNRIVKITNGHIKLANIITMAGLSDAERDRIVTTNLDYMTLLSGGQKFITAHSTNYSIRGGQVPVDYADKYEANVIAGNGHITGIQHTKSGRFWGFELGTMANPNKMAYAQRALTKFPKMQQSFVTVIDGAVKLYGSGKPLTDWEAELSSV